MPPSGGGEDGNRTIEHNINLREKRALQNIKRIAATYTEREERIKRKLDNKWS